MIEFIQIDHLTFITQLHAASSLGSDPHLTLFSPLPGDLVECIMARLPAFTDQIARSRSSALYAVVWFFPEQFYSFTKRNVYRPFFFSTSYSVQPS
ncbi:hypothetical protein [Brevibacillus brevis]|uniref:hypothetical protein n=1 Tax=Brevibacillus brevis TaxID=1393 RepID=UPI001477145A|nr:hypothetical protein [Brevibacillus brevis]